MSAGQCSEGGDCVGAELEVDPNFTLGKGDHDIQGLVFRSLESRTGRRDAASQDKAKRQLLAATQRAPSACAARQGRGAIGREFGTLSGGLVDHTL